MTSSCMEKAIVKPRPTPTLYGRSAWQDAVNSIRTIPEKQKRPVSMPPNKDSMQGFTGEPSMALQGGTLPDYLPPANKTPTV